ncbi:hypothetical protein HBH64_227020 [Parastagonospora nodorum]|nr:hypothetical protein HBI02_229870 [Parastagonospora nodorum]KAH4295377.1 hypothetical protein HBI01_158120 [Parastagonospora nodorum]KAH4295457.1 hypothetical protein HBI01_156160 [Parastagonospora nodorum]KAH4321482.1 hypothetical protein HBI00_212010 [Parastagonospora nodorum]KAH4356278.1 hypothetical protein HBH94_229430 [Parastagonospora nodorum]
MTQPPLWVRKHVDISLANGPLPSGITVTNTGDTPRYQISTGGVLMKFSHHPLSPEGRNEWKDVLPMAPVENGSKAETPGVAHPPIIYKPSEWLWKTQGSFKEILAKAFSISNANITPEQIVSKETNRAVEEHMKAYSVLYHPCDRRSLVIYDKEHYLSCLARHFNRGLIVVGPELKEKKKYLAHGFASPIERQAIRARYSTGLQEDFPPIILGYIPTSEEFAKWFYLEPTGAMVESYQKAMKGYVYALSSLLKYVTNNHSCDWANEARRFGYDNTDKFVRAAVSIQRSIVLGFLTVPKEYLGYAIMEYGKYLAKRGNQGYGKELFDLKRTQKSADSYPQVTFDELTLWILTSGGVSTARRFSNAWSKVIRQYLVFRRSLNTADWVQFIQAVSVLQKQ